MKFGVEANSLRARQLASPLPSHCCMIRHNEFDTDVVPSILCLFDTLSRRSSGDSATSPNMPYNANAFMTLSCAVDRGVTVAGGAVEEFGAAGKEVME